MDYRNWKIKQFTSSEDMMKWIFDNIDKYEMHSKDLSVKYISLNKKHS